MIELPLVSARAVELRVKRARWYTPRSFMDAAPSFQAPSWNAWRSIVTRLTAEVREFYAIAGRGSGKSRIAAMLASCFAVRTYRRTPGEHIYVGIFAPDRKQAKITFGYVLGLLTSAEELARMIVREVKESVELSNGVVIEVMTASKTASRSRSYALAIIEEAAFLPQDESAEPDVELVRAVRPALARVPGSLLVVISSPYAKRGVLWQAWHKHLELEAKGEVDPSTIIVNEPTLTLNPTFDADAVRRAYEDDPTAAATEYDAAFRSDIDTFVTREAVEACVHKGCFERGWLSSVGYRAFVDPSGGRMDSMTLAIGHADEKQRVVLDLVLERRAPFSPEAVVRDFADALKRYRIDEVEGDRYAGEWPVEMFATHGIEYQHAEQSKSELYIDALPLINSGRADLIDSARLIEQLVGLERRTGRGGRDTVDHQPGGHDDVANAACGVMVALSRSPNPLEGRLVL